MEDMQEIFELFFGNIARKIKIVALVTTILGIVGSVISGLILIFTGAFLIGLITAVVGALSTWIGSFVLYGFGELVENSSILAQSVKQPAEPESEDLSFVSEGYVPKARKEVPQEKIPAWKRIEMEDQGIPVPAAPTKSYKETPTSAPMPQNSVPAWKRVEMEEQD